MTNPIVVERMVLQTKVGGTEQTKVRKHYYWCPGCDGLHGITINPDKGANGAGWEFTGTLECPTYSPSQLSSGGAGNVRCHTFIKGGMIQFLDDCTHKLKGKTVPMVPMPDGMFN